jgi:SIR2-like domain
MTKFHDPRREIETLRDHLASHDKPLAFLIGAGASLAARDIDGQALIPGIVDLGKLCRTKVEALGARWATAYEAIAGQLRESLEREPNIEDILSSVRGKVAALAPKGDELAGLDREAMELLERTLRETIAAAVRPGEERIAYPLPHQALASWINAVERRHAVEIFTTNYDTLIERALEDEQVPLFDGFVGSREPYFEPATLAHEDDAPGKRWARLWKIHGSINWHRSNRPSERIIRTDERASGELIYPSLHKYEESRKQPFVAMLQRLGDVLHHRDETVLFTLGYGWGDQHINAIILEALAARERTHVIALMFEDVADDAEPVRHGRHNLTVLGPKMAMIGGIRGPWRLLDPVDRKTADLLDVPFDSDALEGDETGPALSGRMRLGDFNWFARFLREISAYDE